MSVELYITSSWVKDFDDGSEVEKLSLRWDWWIPGMGDNPWKGEESFDLVTEEKYLWYIGGYIVKKV